MSYKIPTSSVVSSQFPEFVREDYPTFIRFVELYYQFLNENNVNGIGSSFDSVRDIDETLNKFVDALWQEMGVNVPRTSIPDDKYFLKHIKEFYSSKGSEESFRTLFRHLFNTEIEIKYPKDYIFKTSAGKWNQDISVVVDVTKGNIFDVIGQQICINTKTQIIKVVVKNVLVLNDLYEIFFEPFQTLLISVGDVLQYGSVTATIVDSLVSVIPYSSGKGFHVGQLFDIPSVLGANARIKIKQVDSVGGILQTEILNFGSNYNNNFYANVISGYGNIATTPDEFVYDGNVITQINLTDSTNGFIEKGFVSSVTYCDSYYCDSSYSGEIIREFYSDTTSPVGTFVSNADIATLSVVTGAVRKYPGFYLNASGFTSDSYYLQDGNFYQLFSYVISSIESINSYKDVVKTLVHPAGLKMFGEQIFSNTLSISETIAILGLHFQEVIHDKVWSTDLEIYSMLKPLIDSVFTPEIETYSLNKVLTELPIIASDIDDGSYIIYCDESYCVDDLYYQYCDIAYADDYFVSTHTISYFEPVKVAGYENDISKSLVENLTIDDSSLEFGFSRNLTEVMTFYDIDHPNELAGYCDLSYSESLYFELPNAVYTNDVSKILEDSISFTETITEYYCDGSYCDETYVLGLETGVYTSSLVKSFEDTVGITDTIYIQKTKSIPDEITVNDDLKITYNYQYADSVTIAAVYGDLSYWDPTYVLETLGDICDIISTKPITDNAITSDLETITSNKLLNDSISVTDVLTSSKENNESYTDSLAISDVINITLSANESLIDSASTNDTNTSIFNKGLIDTVTSSDVINIASVDNETYIDTIASSDVDTITLSKQLIDSVTPSDTINVQLVDNRTYSESISLSDIKTGSSAKSINDTVLSSDTINIQLNDSRVFTDTFSLTDSGTIVTNKGFADSLTYSDVITVQLNGNTFYTDSVTSTDIKTYASSKPLTETVSVSDVISVQLNDNRVFLESITTTDTQETITTNKQLLETIIASDIININNVKGYVDSVTSTDIKTYVSNKGFSDTVTTSDSETIAYGQQLNDSISIGTEYWDSSYSDNTYTRTTIDPIITYSNNTYTITLTN